MIFLIQTNCYDNCRYEIFGYYLNTEVKQVDEMKTSVDDNTFEFCLRGYTFFKEPMKFEIVDTENGGYHLYQQPDYQLINLGNIYLLCGRNQSYYHLNDENRTYFNYHDNVKDDIYGGFDMERLLIIQMK